MMKKRLNKGLKSLLVFVLSLSIFGIYDVYADDKEMTDYCEETFSGNQSEISRCNVCKSKLANKFNWVDIDQNDNEIKAKITGDANKTFHLTIKYTDGFSTTKDVNTNEEFTIPSRFTGNNYVKININGVLNSEATVKSDGNTFSCNGKFVVESNYTYESNTEDGYANKSKNGVCARYKSGTLSDSDKKAIGATIFEKLTGNGELSFGKIKNVSGGVAQFDNLFPYCNMDTVKDIYSDKMVLSQIYNAASIVINKSTFTTTTLPDSESAGFKKIDINNLKNAISLTCDAFAKSNERKFYYESSESKYMIFHTTPNNNSETKVCSSVCREEITITYGPPVAVKAGMCFEYEVEVKSKVTCNAKIENDMPKMSDYVSCTPTAHCNNHGGYYFDQGGPSEEFDSCINSIDGGKYTQKAIDKCYTKVYGKKNKKSKVSNTSLYNSSVEKLANSSNPNWCNNPGSIRTESSAAQVYNSYRNGYQGGYYYRKDGKINWQKYDSTYSNEDKRKLADGSVIPIYPGCYWNGYGRYYFGSYTKGVRTVLNDSHIRINYADGGDRLSYWQYIPVNGFKKGSVCNEYCIWKAPTNCYLNVLAPNSGNGKGNSAYNAYYNDMDNYNKAIEGCKADAKCNESTAKYIMTVNKADGDITACKESGSGLVDGNKCTTWNEENGNNKGLTRKDKDHTIVKEVNGVCTDDNDKSGYKYRALISFPGSYVNNKNGVVKFNVPDEDKAFYSYKNGQYCVPLNAKNWIFNRFINNV